MLAKVKKMKYFRRNVRERSRLHDWREDLKMPAKRRFWPISWRYFTRFDICRASIVVLDSESLHQTPTGERRRKEGEKRRKKIEENRVRLQKSVVGGSLENPKILVFWFMFVIITLTCTLWFPGGPWRSSSTCSLSCACLAQHFSSSNLFLKRSDWRLVDSATVTWFPRRKPTTTVLFGPEEEEEREEKRKEKGEEREYIH